MLVNIDCLFQTQSILSLYHHPYFHDDRLSELCVKTFLILGVQSDKMEFLNSQYFKNNERLLKACGLWPYQSNLKNASKYVIFTITTFSMTFAMVAGVYSQVNAELLSILETITALLYCGGALITYTILYTKIYQIKSRFDRIVAHWIKSADDSERKIMRDLFMEARSAIFITFGYAFPAFGLFICLTFFPRMFSKNSLEQCLNTFPYYFKPMVIYENTCDLQVFVHFTVALLFASMAFLAVSTTYITSVKHVCAQFGIASYRLRNAVVYSENIDPIKESIKDASIIPSLIKVIDIHKEALRGVQDIEQNFSLGFFFLEIGTLAFLAIFIFEVNYHVGNVRELLRFLPAMLIFIIYVFFLNWCGEQVIQACDDLRTSAYNIDWYRISSRVRIFVLMIMQRTTKPVHLTAGTVILLSIKNFTTILKTAWSFGMLLISMQNPGRKKNANFVAY